MDESTTTATQLVLCFDGTGNTFRADGTETNILRICRMLGRPDQQLVYYQPGLGTEITAGSLAATTLKTSSRLGKSKTLSQALGKSFEKHILGGYRFLMRHYRSDSQIYMFGFSRGAYTARFLADMLDYAGLLGPDNEEMIPFIWNAFSKWRLARYNDTFEKAEAYSFMRSCRETLCRRTSPLRFLGLFDTVNSVTDFEINNDIVSTARVTRHAVSIDERRVKFQPVLLPTSSSEVGGKVLPDTSSPPQNAAKDSSVSQDQTKRDVLEVWFPGCHADIGGGFAPRPGETGQLSHAPLVWMVQEAQRAGLIFDKERLQHFNCLEPETPGNEPGTDGPDSNSARQAFLRTLVVSSETGRLNDRLEFGQGFSIGSVITWRLMEYLPIRRADALPDGTWGLMRWPVSRGSLRDMRLDALVHVSAIRRLKADKTYRPLNLIVGGGSRGCRRAPIEYGIGCWVVKDHRDDPVRELYTRGS